MCLFKLITSKLAAKCSGFGWGRLTVLHSSWDGLCFNCVTKILLITQECFVIADWSQRLSCCSPHPTRDEAGNEQEQRVNGAGRGHSWDNWPWLAQGTSHTIWGHGHLTNLWPNVPNFAHDSFALAASGAANWFYGHLKWTTEEAWQEGRKSQALHLPWFTAVKPVPSAAESEKMKIYKHLVITQEWG